MSTVLKIQAEKMPKAYPMMTEPAKLRTKSTRAVKNSSAPMLIPTNLPVVLKRVMATASFMTYEEGESEGGGTGGREAGGLTDSPKTR
jgi:hypothetical protein